MKDEVKEADENVAENGKHSRRKNEQDRIRMSRMIEGERERKKHRIGKRRERERKRTKATKMVDIVENA